MALLCSATKASIYSSFGTCYSYSNTSTKLNGTIQLDNVTVLDIFINLGLAMFIVNVDMIANAMAVDPILLADQLTFVRSVCSIRSVCFVRPSVRSFVRSFVCSFIRLFIPLIY